MLKSLVRNSLGGLIIMGVATLAGIAHNSMRSKPMALIPRVQAGPAGAANSTTSGLAAADSHSSSSALSEGLISIEKIKQAMSDPAIIIIDARAETAFNDGHISGAINVPYDRFTEYYDFLLASVPMDATVICYCWSPTCDFSDQLAQELRFMGYTNVLICREGWDAWQEAGYPSEP
jgi:rhodanese-related sulfurtransferase